MTEQENGTDIAPRGQIAITVTYAAPKTGRHGANNLGQVPTNVARHTGG
jgi:hypothetical protein